MYKTPSTLNLILQGKKLKSCTFYTINGNDNHLGLFRETNRYVNKSTDTNEKSFTNLAWYFNADLIQDPADNGILLLLIPRLRENIIKGIIDWKTINVYKRCLMVDKCLLWWLNLNCCGWCVKVKEYFQVFQPIGHMALALCFKDQSFNTLGIRCAYYV